MNVKTQQNSPTPADITDAALVAASLDGDRQAYAQIVTRYQSLLCSVAYSSLGNLASSEDLAQETFVEAWSKLTNLDDPDKLRPWLCGILRFKLSHHHRRESRQPLSRAGDLDQVLNLASGVPDAEDTTMKEEEQALLWHALERVPANYREVLVLYYREHRSIAQVAEDLELSQATVKQRLSRGRKMLQERVMSFVETALKRSTPGHVFTAGVIAALPTLAVPAKAAGTGAIATQAASAIKWASFGAFLASVSGFISTAFALRANLDQSRTRRERRRVVRVVILFLAIAIGFCLGLFGLRQAALSMESHQLALAWVAQAVVAAFAIGYTVLTYRLLRDSRALRSAERLRRPDRFTSEVDQPDSPNREYRSRLTLFGIPLVHLQFAMAEQGDAPAIGWIAAGERAYGVLFAWGGFAVGTISVGIVSVGIVSVGAVGFGVIALGTVGIGLLAIGAAAVGVTAFGSLSALGWTGAAGGGFSIARHGAAGPLAFAPEVNNERAAELLNLALVDQSAGAVLFLLAAIVIVPVVLYARAVRQRLGEHR